MRPDAERERAEKADDAEHAQAGAGAKKGAGERLRFLRRGMALVTLLVTFFLIVMYMFVGDRHAWSEWFTVWPSFLWLIGLVPMAAVGFSPRWRGISWVMIAALGVFVAGTMEWRSLLRGGGEEKPEDALRIVTWNIADANDAACLERLAPLRPDVCFLQETPDSAAAFAGERLSGAWEGYHWWDAGDCGMLSRFPIERLPTERIGPWDVPQVGRITTAQGETVIVVNVRLMLPSLVLNPLSAENRRRLREGHAARLAQYPALAKLIAKARGETPTAQVVLAGDFNTQGGAASLAPLRGALRDVWGESGRGWGGTMTQSFPVARIDQCWVTAGVEAVQARVEDGAPSDHEILVVDLRFREDWE